MTCKFIQSHVISFCISLTILVVSLSTTIPASGSDDPWPHWQRTATRLGNTDTIGPRLARIEWSAQYTTDPFPASSRLALLIDRHGYLIAGSGYGVAVLDPVTHEMIWEQAILDNPGRPAISNDRVVIGKAAPNSIVYCFDVKTGEELWSQDTGGSLRPPVIANGIVFISDAVARKVWAFDLFDGTLLWSITTHDAIYDTPSIDWPDLLISAGRPSASGVFGIIPFTDVPLWQFRTDREIQGTAPIHAGSVYVASMDRWLYAFDAQTGQERWRFWTEQLNLGAVAIGHDGTVYTGTSGNIGLLFAISPDGEQIWRHEMPDDISNGPIIDGENHIYVTTMNWSVHAFLPDGTEQWTRDMPENVRSSPTLGPDGTLYIICKDKNLYAFRDPHLRASITGLKVTTGTILDGGIDDIAEPDGAYLHTRSGFGRQLSELHKTELLINATVADSQPAIMRIQIESRTDQPSAMAIVQLRNWTTGNFETVRNYEVESEEEYEWIQIPKGGNGEQVNPQRYIRPSGGIEMKLKHLIFVPFLAFTFESFIDQIKIEVTG